MAGLLYLVPVPIGNLEDITLRASNILKSVDFVIAEDTRHSLKLLSHLDIKKRIVSYYKHKENEKSAGIIKELAKQDAALITDSGTPLISDPGFILIKAAIKKGIKVIPLPGPSAFLPALVASGIPADQFLFLGFPPRKKGELERFLISIKDYPFTLIFYESPRRVEAFLDAAGNILGNRLYAVAKEVSKKNEKIIRGHLADLELLKKNEILLGEMVIVIAGAGKQETDKKKLHLSTRDDMYKFFKNNYNLSKNEIKKILMKK